MYVCVYVYIRPYTYKHTCAYTRIHTYIHIIPVVHAMEKEVAISQLIV